MAAHSTIWCEARPSADGVAVDLAGGARRAGPDVHVAARLPRVAITVALDRLPVWARDLLSEVPVAHLGVLDGDGHPRVLPVTFAVAAGAIWSAVDEKPKRRAGEQLARVRWLRARPQSTITIDRYDDDWTRLAWVQLIGVTAVVDAAGQDEVLAALAERYAPYRGAPPPGPLLRLTPSRAVCWRAQG